MSTVISVISADVLLYLGLKKARSFEHLLKIRNASESLLMRMRMCMHGCVYTCECACVRNDESDFVISTMYGMTQYIYIMGIYDYHRIICLVDKGTEQKLHDIMSQKILS